MDVDDSSIQYGFQFIKQICDKFGPRISGTTAEKASAEYTQQELQKFADETSLDPFPVYPEWYPGGFIRTAAVFVVCATPFILMRGAWPLLALFFPLFALFILFSSLILMKTWFAHGFKKGTSQNATGRIFPRNAGKKVEPKARVVVAGHLDSAFQMPITKYGDNKIKVGIPGVSYILILILFSIIKASSNSSGNLTPITEAGVFFISWIDIVFIVVTCILLPFFFLLIRGLTGGVPVMGASDNLAGVGIGMALAHYFSQDAHRLKNVEVWTGGFGSEECGERGAEAFVKKYGQMGLLDIAHAPIPDTCGAGERLVIISAEPMHRAKHSPEVCNRMRKAYDKYLEVEKPLNPVPCEGPKPLPFAASDAGRFSLKGYKAAFLFACQGKLLSPKGWHSESDTFENLDPPLFAAGFKLYKYYIQMLDEDLSHSSS